MFEKEAKEWVDKMYPCDGQAQRYLLMGAEFGYNKAKEELEKENTKLKELINVILANKKLLHIRNLEHLSSTDIEILECKLERWFIEAEDFIKE